MKTLFKMYCGNKIIRAELASKTVKTVKIEEIGLFTLATDHLDCEVHLFDSPGYGDFINNLDAIETVKYHLEQAHKAWLETRGNEMTEKVMTLHIICSEITLFIVYVFVNTGP